MLLLIVILKILLFQGYQIKKFFEFLTMLCITFLLGNLYFSPN